MTTPAERAARMEALLGEVIKKLDKMEAKVDALDATVRQDVADLQAIKNRGAGVLIGVGLACGAVGSSLTAWLGHLWK